jgi:subtilisin family serine protease
MRSSRRVVAAACSMAALAALIAGLLSVSATAGATAQLPSQRVIVVLKNQETGLPATKTDVAARQTAVGRDQAPLISSLGASGALDVHSYTLINAVSATVTPAEESSLRANPAVSEVVTDQPIRLAAPATALGASSAGAAKPATASAAACAAGGGVQLNPQALSIIGADSDDPTARTARSLGFTGAGVTVGFIADGLDINDPDFIRADGSHVFVDYKDFSGEGTAVATGGEEAFGDASSIAAQGREVYDVAGYGPEGVQTSCKIRVEGVAPGASLVGLDIFGAEDAGFNSSFLQAIDYAVTTDHVNVLNESLGNNYYPDDAGSLDLVKQANDAAVAAGTTVTVSSGDAGVTSTIGTPATDPAVISAGATTSYRVDLQDGYGGAQFPGVTGYLNDNISSFSSAGFEQDGQTVDVVAPGELNWALCSTDTAMYGDCVSYAGNPTPVLPFGGTSESAPLTAGVAALVIQAYEKTHGGVAPTPAIVKQIITGTADDIGSPADQQGSGRIDALRAVLAAEGYDAGASAPLSAGGSVLSSPTQLNVIAQPGTAETVTDTVTNHGPAAETVAVSSRTLGPYTSIANQTVTLSDTASPHTTDWAGVPSNYEKVTFTVPAGVNRLNAAIAFQNASETDLAARVRLTLVDPIGRLAAYSVPQGDGNYGDVQVTNPLAGTWTGYVWSRESPDGGTTGPVVFGAGVAHYGVFGTVSPTSLSLAPGQSAPVSLTVSTPATPGDAWGSIVLKSAGTTTTVPVTLRSLIPSAPTTFTADLTGGNGRSSITGETFYYQIDVPAGAPELNASVALADDPDNPFTVFLISPSGEAVATGANELPSDSATGYTNELGAQVHALAPVAGRWTVIVAFIPQVSGTAIEEPFSVHTDELAAPVSGAGLPDSGGTQLTAGKARTFMVSVTNDGPSAQAYFVDARLPGSETLNLAALNSPDTTVPISVEQNIPAYLVPTETTSMSASASTTGPTPIEFDSSAPAGDPDIGSTVGSSVVGGISADPVSPGVWGLVPDVVGAFGVTGPASESVTTAMTTTSSPFDPAVSSPTGDEWEESVDLSALDSFAPVVIEPGQTGEIPVTITAAGSPGSAATGTLYVDSADEFLFQNYFTLNGSEVAALPYRYTVVGATTTTLTASPASPSVYGQPVTLTATVAPSDGGGTVAFTSDGATIPGCGAQSLSASAPFTATCVTGALGVGSHSLVATYSGDAAYAGSTSSPVTYKVGKAATTTTLTASPPSPSSFGQVVTFTASVAATPPGAGVPTGSVAFAVDGSPVGSASLVGGKASIAIGNLSAGTHTITATYGGDGNFSGSSSSELSYTVGCAVTITGYHPGVLEVTASTCVSSGAQVGAVIVKPGGTLDIEGASVGGSIEATDAPGAIRICDSQISGSVDIADASGLVIVGDPAIGCTANTINGSLLLENDTNGVEAIDNTVHGAVVTTGDSGPGPYPGQGTTITGNGP